MAILKYFTIYRQLLFYFKVFAKARFTDGPTKSSWLLTLLPNYKVSNLQSIFQNWRRAHLKFGFAQMLESSKSNWWGRDVASIEEGCFHLRCWIKNIFFPFFFPLWPSFPNSYTMKIFFHLFFWLLPGKIMPLFTYLRLLQGWWAVGGLGNPTSKWLLEIPWW